MPNTVSINRNLIDLEYAVRGPLAIRAAELVKQGRDIILCNLGNPQALGQKPITFYRQILSLLEYPEAIINEREKGNLISKDVLNYTEDFLANCKSLGAYTESMGPLFIRDAVARFIDNRDDVTSSSGVVSDSNAIFLTDGASAGARNIIELLIADSKDGIMIPIPQYPLYSATIKRCRGVQVNYFPDEDNDWALNRDMLDESIKGAREKGVNVKAIVVINPGNPTGAILDEESINDVIKFAGENDIAIIADEVYQDNLYGAEFISFAKAVGDKDIPLFSLHSASKGFHGECGHRGGYLEVRNPPKIAGSDAHFNTILVKQASVSLCSNTVGQALLYMVVNPPQKGDDSFALFENEKRAVLDSQLEKATMIKEAFKEMDVDAKREVVEALLDRDVRPMLIMDGGNMEILDIQENGEHTDIYIRYLGACSGCAASSLGTLYAIGNTLREKFGENIRVSPV